MRIAILDRCRCGNLLDTPGPWWLWPFLRAEIRGMRKTKEPGLCPICGKKPVPIPYKRVVE